MTFVTSIDFNEIPVDHLKPWLSQRQALSQTIANHTGVHPTLTLYRQGWVDLSPWEQTQLGSEGGASAWCRDICLRDDNNIWSYGHTVVPNVTYRAYQHTFDTLGTQLLGRDFLYQTQATRSEFQYFMAKPGAALYEQVRQDTAQPAPAFYLGRHSMFHLDKGPLLLCEILMSRLPVFQP